MPIQIIITGNDAQEAMSHMASFIGMRGLQDVGRRDYEGDIQAPTNGGPAETETEAPKPSKRTSRAKAAPEPAPEPAPEAEAEIDPGDAVRSALNLYVKKFGMDATQPDILALYKMIFKDSVVTMVSEIPEGRHEDVIAGIEEMLTKNPFKRKRVDE